MNQGRHRTLPPVRLRRPIVDEKLVVEVKTIASIGAGAQAVVTIDRSNDLAGPAHRVILQRNAGSRSDVVPLKVESRIDTRVSSSVRQIRVREIFRFQAGLRIRSSRAENGGRDRQRASFSNWRANSIRNPGIREPIPYAGQNGGVARGVAVVIAEEGIERVGCRAYDRDGFDGRFKRQSIALILQKDDGFAS